MNGVMSIDMETLIKNTELKIEDVSENITNLRMASLELRRCIKNSELSFLTYGLYKEITYMNNTLKKLNAYNTCLKKVLQSYTKEAQAIASSVRSAS